MSLTFTEKLHLMLHGSLLYSGHRIPGSAKLQSMWLSSLTQIFETREPNWSCFCLVKTLNDSLDDTHHCESPKRTSASSVLAPGQISRPKPTFPKAFFPTTAITDNASVCIELKSFSNEGNEILLLWSRRGLETGGFHAIDGLGLLGMAKRDPIHKKLMGSIRLVLIFSQRKETENTLPLAWSAPKLVEELSSMCGLFWEDLWSSGK